jgi:endonuclease/exonuclease/phosphatase (EEP) superfamily protein YafD
MRPELLILPLALAACGGAATINSQSDVTASAEAQLNEESFDGTLRVMTYNIWGGGSQSIEKTIEAIEASGADVVGLQELSNEANLKTIADGLGFYYDWTSGIASRYPISDAVDFSRARWGGAVINLPEGQEVVVLNTHLTAYPYGPYEVRDGNAANEKAAFQVEEDSGRWPEVRNALETYQDSFDQDLPAFFTGDFNTPSYLDWTERNKDKYFDMVVRWPVMTETNRAGFKDGFRAVHPDEVAVPGYTWSPGYPVGNIADDDVMDRIDFVLYRGDEIEVVDAEVVAETGPYTDIAVDPWPSDHRAVVVEFKLPTD